MILDSAEEFGVSAAAKEPLNDAPKLLVFSANTQDSLKRLAANCQDYLKLHPERLTDLAYTLSLRREHLPHRAFSVAGNGISKDVSPFIKVATGNVPEIAMIFTGQGSNWPGMGKEFIEADPKVREDIIAMDEILQSLKYPPDWRIEGKELVF